MQKLIHDYAFADKIVPSDSGKLDQITKAEIAVLVSIQGWPTVAKNMGTLCEISENAVRAACGSNYLHLVRQLRKESTDKFTEAKKIFALYDKEYFLVRAYKFVGEDYFKLEVTRALQRHQESMLLETTLGTSLYLLQKIVGGAAPWMIPEYMHRKDFTPVAELLGRY